MSTGNKEQGTSNKMKNNSTAWDKIYRRYLGKKKVMTIGADLHPFFVDFVKSHKFSKKSVLDIGCGEGRYLKYLQDRGFEVVGIDSSAKAVEVTRDLLHETKKVQVADMYTYKIPAHQYDLIVSVATIQHGHKSDIAALIGRIHDSLLPGGQTFITISETESVRKRHLPVNEIAPGTYEPLEGPEKGLLHSGFSQAETRKMFSSFTKIEIAQDRLHRWVVMAQK